MQKHFLIILIFSLAFSLTSFSQTDSTSSSTEDTSTVEKKKFFTPQRIAGYLSAVVPGAGQAYNKQYWKAPVIYGLGGLFMYTIVNNQKGYKRYDDAYKIRTDGDSTTLVELDLQQFTDNNLQRIREDYRRKRDVYIIYTSLLYVANIVDAVVGAHLRDFEISEDLSLHISPTMYAMNNQLATGVSFQFNIK